MRGDLKREGKYELFKTTNGNQIIALEDKDYFALVEGQKGDIIVKSNSDHEKAKTVSKGKYFLADFKDDPEFQDMQHLFMEEGKHFKELVLPEGLPTKSNKQKKLVRPKEKLPQAKVMEHVKGKGNKGSEKQYKGEKEGLRAKTKKELYGMAKKQDIKNRSKMTKEELVKELEKS